VHHHMKVTAIGADLGLSDPARYDEVLTSIAPLPFIGEGVFTLTPDNDLVVAFQDAVARENDELLESVVFRLATRLVPVLGQVTVVHRLNTAA
jgi:hypothetical protein